MRFYMIRAHQPLEGTARRAPTVRAYVATLSHDERTHITAMRQIPHHTATSVTRRLNAELGMRRTRGRRYCYEILPILAALVGARRAVPPGLLWWRNVTPHAMTKRGAKIPPRSNAKKAIARYSATASFLRGQPAASSFARSMSSVRSLIPASGMFVPGAKIATAPCS